MRLIFITLLALGVATVAMSDGMSDEEWSELLAEPEAEFVDFPPPAAYGIGSTPPSDSWWNRVPMRTELESVPVPIATRASWDPVEVRRPWRGCMGRSVCEALHR